MRIARHTGSPTETRDVFRWVFTTAGFWLILSPFLFLNGQSGYGNAVFGEAETLLIVGFVALLLAGLCYKKHDLLQVIAGLILGVTLVLSPLAIGFASNTLAATNVILAGASIIFFSCVEALYFYNKNRAQ